MSWKISCVALSLLFLKWLNLNSRMKFFYLIFLILASSAPKFGNAQLDGTIVKRYNSTFDKPPSKVPSTVAVDAPLLGNGYSAAAISGAPEEQTYYLARNDFWRLKSGYRESFPAVLGKLVIQIPELKGASYKVEQNFYNGVTNGVFKKGDIVAEFISYLNPGDFLIVTLENSGKKLINGEVTLSPSGDSQFDVKPPLQNKFKDTVAFGIRNGVQWIVRGFVDDIDISTMASSTCRVIGKEKKFTLSPGQKVTIICGFSGNFSEKSFLKNLINKTASVSSRKIEDQKKEHEKFWREFWNESQVSIGDTIIEAQYYRSHFIMASCSRNPKFPPGIFGSWITKEIPAWSGDYHLNYNYTAPFYALYSSNHLMQAKPYETPLLDFMPRGKYYSAKIANISDGILYPVGIGPLGIETTKRNELLEKYRKGYISDGNVEDEGLFFGQKSNASYCLVNMSFAFYHTYDTKYAKKIYPYVKAVARFWEQYVKMENGKYVITNDAVHEGTIGNKNSILSLGLAHMVLQTACDISLFLNKDEAARKRWKNVLDNLAEFPTQIRNGKRVFRYSETGTDWWDGNTLGIQHIYPSGQISISSDTALLTIARNTIKEMHRWNDSNGSNSFFPAAVRVGYNADTILTKLRAWCLHTYPNGFQLNNPHGIENCSTVPNTINEMLCTAHDGVLRVFGNWPKSRDAIFNKLRADGAFLVSSEQKNGEVLFIKIVSEKGKYCIVDSPWPTKKVLIKGKETIIIQGKLLKFKTGILSETTLQPQ